MDAFSKEQKELIARKAYDAVDALNRMLKDCEEAGLNLSIEVKMVANPVDPTGKPTFIYEGHVCEHVTYKREKENA